MNWAQIQSQWQQYKDQIKQRWSKLTDHDLTVINGRREVLAGKLLGSSVAKDQIEKEIAEFEASCVLNGSATVAVAPTPAAAMTPVVGTVGENLRDLSGRRSDQDSLRNASL